MLTWQTDQIKQASDWTPINLPSEGFRREPVHPAHSQPIACSAVQAPNPGNELPGNHPWSLDTSISKTPRGLFPTSPADHFHPNRAPGARADTTSGASTTKPRPEHPRRSHSVHNPRRDINHQVRNIVLTDRNIGATLTLIDDDDYDPPTSYRTDDVKPADFARAAELGKLRCTGRRRWRPVLGVGGGGRRIGFSDQGRRGACSVMLGLRLYLG